MYLVFIDFSGPSINALGYAASLASKSNEEIILCHELTHEDSLDEDIDHIVVEKRKEEAENELERISHFANPKNNVRFQYKVFEEMTETDFMKLVNNRGIKIVFTGITSKSAVRKWLFGSRAVDLVELLDCPLMIIPEKAKLELPGNILLPVRNKECIVGFYETLAKDVFKNLEPQITTLYLTKDKAENSILDSQANFITVESKDDLVTIESKMESMKPQLTCIPVNSDDNKLSFSRSTVQKLALFTSGPMLVLPE